MKLIFVYEALLYYCCLIFITRYILGFKPKIGALSSSFLGFATLAVLAIVNNDNLFNIAFAAFLITQFGLIRLMFKEIKLRYIIFSYILIYSSNVLLITIITTFISSHHLQIDIIVNTITAILYVLACLSKVRTKIQQILEFVPKHVLVITSFLLVSTSFLSVFISGSTDASHKETWGSIINVSLIALLFSICTVFPLFILTSISNNQLKSLTASYEKQIQVQAEHYKNLAAANFETRRFKHDFKNISVAIEKLLADGKYDQTMEILQKYNYALNAPGASCPAFDTGNGIADALLIDKSEKASAFHTEITFNGAIPQDFLSPTDLCVILGNTLDNAIEACQRLDQETVKTISVSCNCSSGFLFLSIVNPVSEQVIIHDNHVATTKENKTLHGFGLYSLHSIVKKYDGEVRLSSTDDRFTVDIDLCTPKYENCLPQ